jgi:hypothetical protein
MTHQERVNLKKPFIREETNERKKQNSMEVLEKPLNNFNYSEKRKICQIKACLYTYKNPYECKFCGEWFCDAHYIFRHSKCIECYKKSDLKFIPVINLN